MRKFLLATALVCFISCKTNQIPKETYNTEYYEILNYVINNHYKNASIIVNETKPVYKTLNGKSDSDSTFMPTWLHFRKSYFDFHAKYNHISEADAEFMFNAIDSTRIIKFDSTEIKIKVVSADEYRILQGKPVVCIEASTAIFNSTFSHAVIAIKYTYGQTTRGSTFFLEKRYGKWTYIERIYAVNDIQP